MKKRYIGKKCKIKKDMLKGSATVEMSFLMPIILMLLLSSILAVFYFHDKNILSGAAYETAVIGSVRSRQRNGIKSSELAAVFRERAKGKCILFGSYDVGADIGDKEITVKVTAKKKKLKLSVEKKAALTDPEKKIRDIRRIKETVNGAKDNN